MSSPSTVSSQEKRSDIRYAARWTASTGETATWNARTCPTVIAEPQRRAQAPDETCELWDACDPCRHHRRPRTRCRNMRRVRRVRRGTHDPVPDSASVVGTAWQRECVVVDVDDVVVVVVVVEGCLWSLRCGWCVALCVIAGGAGSTSCRPSASRQRRRNRSGYGDKERLLLVHKRPLALARRPQLTSTDVAVNQGGGQRRGPSSPTPSSAAQRERYG